MAKSNPTLIDLTGQRFGRWQVLSKSHSDDTHVYWHCICDCGTRRAVRGNGLKRQQSQSCGCLAREIWRQSRNVKHDLTGQRFGRLIVLRLGVTKKSRHRYWVCQCDCGSIKEIAQLSLRQGHSKSCGCYRRETAVKHIDGTPKVLKHGMANTPEYRIWSGMMTRCYNPNRECYKYYGGRGIYVCERWHAFPLFYADMGPRPSPEMEIDRKDNDGPYSPENCQWTTFLVNVRNRRTNRYVEYQGRKWCRSELAKHLGINYSTLRTRLDNGWSIAEAIETPILKSRYERNRYRV